MKCKRIAIDVAKSVFEVAVSEEAGKVSERLRFTRRRLMEFLARQEVSLVVLEACGSSHHLARRIQALGHEVELLPAHQAKRYVLRDKTDREDASALLEAQRNASIRRVPVKTGEQQGVMSLHRIRRNWMKTRVARLNTLRGLLREFGVLIPVGANRVVPAARLAIADADNEIPESLRGVLVELCEEVRELEGRIEELKEQISRRCSEDPEVKRLETIIGIGPLTATALVAQVVSPTRFPSGRHFSSYLGLVPKEHSSGNRRSLGAITKRGDRYLRSLLIHGARSALGAAKRYGTQEPLLVWALELARTKGHNVAVVALANRNARLAWRIWTQNRNYVPQSERPAA